MTPAYRELVRRLVIEPVMAGMLIAGLVAGILLAGPCAHVRDQDVAPVHAATVRAP